MQELNHSGVKGMRWHIRRAKKGKPDKTYKKSNEEKVENKSHPDNTYQHVEPRNQNEKENEHSLYNDIIRYGYINVPKGTINNMIYEIDKGKKIIYKMLSYK